MKPQDSLRESANVFEERGKIYGTSYLRFGPVMTALFPNGISANDPHDMNRLAMVVQIVSKLVRYAGTFSTGGHDDSLLDLSTYAAMLRELDAEGRVPAKSPFEDPPCRATRDELREWAATSAGQIPMVDSVVPRGDGFRVGEIEPIPKSETGKVEVERRWAEENGDLGTRRFRP